MIYGTEREREILNLATDINSRVGSTLSDDIRVERLFKTIHHTPKDPVPEWMAVVMTLDRPDRSLVIIALGRIYYDHTHPYLHTIGGIRGASIDDLIALRNMGPHRALFLANAFVAAKSESTT